MNSDALPDLRPEAFGSVFVLAQHLARAGDDALEPLGITTKQWLLLAVVGRRFAGRPPTLTEAAAAYGTSRQNVKAIAVALERRGFMRLLPDPTDRRSVRLEVTPKVAAFGEPEWAAREAAFFRSVFDGMDGTDLRQLLDLLRRWLGILVPAVATTIDPF